MKATKAICLPSELSKLTMLNNFLENLDEEIYGFLFAIVSMLIALVLYFFIQIEMSFVDKLINIIDKFL